MKFEKKFQRISENSQVKRDKVVIILGISLLVASCCSYLMIEAFGQVFELDCPENAYHGLDNQGNATCRDILTNSIVSIELTPSLDTYQKIITKSQSISNLETPPTNEISSVDITVFILMGVLGSVVFITIKKRKIIRFQKYGWNRVQKEQVRDRQYGKCNMCFTSPSKWTYYYFDGNKNNGNLNNCQGLCSNCYSKKSQRNNEVFSKN